MKYTATLNLSGNNIGEEFVRTDASYIVGFYNEGKTYITRELWGKDGLRIEVIKSKFFYKHGKNIIHPQWLLSIKMSVREVSKSEIVAGARFMLGDASTYAVVIEAANGEFLFGGRYGSDFTLWGPAIGGRKNADDNVNAKPFTMQQALDYLNNGRWRRYKKD